MTKPVLLIVEDDRDMQRILEKLITTYFPDLGLIIVEYGEEAIDVIYGQQPPIGVITDWTIPGPLNGTDIAHQCHSRGIVSLVLTSQSQDSIGELPKTAMFQLKGETETLARVVQAIKIILDLRDPEVFATEQPQPLPRPGRRIAQNGSTPP